MKTVQPIQSQAPAWQWTWKQSPSPLCWIASRPHIARLLRLSVHSTGSKNIFWYQLVQSTLPRPNIIMCPVSAFHLQMKPQRWCQQNIQSCTDDSPFTDCNQTLFFFLYASVGFSRWICTGCIDFNDICDPKWHLKCRGIFNCLLEYYLLRPLFKKFFLLPTPVSTLAQDCAKERSRWDARLSSVSIVFIPVPWKNLSAKRCCTPFYSVT